MHGQQNVKILKILRNYRPHSELWGVVTNTLVMILNCSSQFIILHENRKAPTTAALGIASPSSLTKFHKLRDLKLSVCEQKV